MDIFIEKLRDKDFPIIFTIKDLETLHYDKNELKGLLEDAILKKNIYHLYKGYYTLHKMYRRSLLSEAVLAQLIEPDSYVSTYYVLSAAGWIPEAVYAVSSITTNKNMKVDLDRFGYFRYDKIYEKTPLAGIYIEENDNGSYKTATPLRAVCDYIHMFNKDWEDAEDLNINLRILDDDLEQLKKEDFEELHNKFGEKNVENFLTGLRKDLRI